MEIIYVHCEKKWDMSNPDSYEHYWTSGWNESWKKKIQACMRFESMISVILV